jgi:hypothetical protein
VDTSNLTPEERSVLRQLVESPGWALLLEKLLIPRMQQITMTLDRPHIELQGHGDYLRGEKRAYMAQMDTLAQATGLPNMLEVYALGLLKAVTRTTDVVATESLRHLVESDSENTLCGLPRNNSVLVVLNPLSATCQVCLAISQEMSARRGRGRATLV